MNTKLGLWVALLTSVTLSAVTIEAMESRPRVELHYGKLKAGESEILERSFVNAEWADAKRSHPDIEFVGPLSSSAAELVAAAQNPATAAIVWVGHPSTIHEAEELKNVFLMDATGRHLPKKIFTAGGDRVRWGVASCHTQGIKKFYTSLRSLLIPISVFEIDDPKSRALVELSSLYSAPQEVLAQVLEALPKSPGRVREFESEVYEIEVSDLMSSRFDYVVLRNGEMIGALQADADPERRGRKQKHSFTVPALKTGESVELEILPDDGNRFRRPGDPEFIVDDILVHSVRRNGVELINTPVHIGDESSSIDRQTQTLRRENLELLLKTPVQETWAWSQP
jgi:hypothetical protein